MNPLIAQHWDRVEAWLDALLDLAPSERAAWLAVHCDDDALRAATLALAAAEDTGEHALTSLRGGITDSPAEGGRVGPYRLLRLLGEGGMATVYLAERTTAEFKQRVALKLMRSGLFSPASLDRFRREQRIHATLEHPHIARVYDSGISAAGVPYFAVEYVDGSPIDVHCDTNRLPVAARLRLFLDVCAGVAFAHRNLVVHRDLKPSNILVTADGTPKLLDFGIAKLIAAPDDAEARTATEHRHLTPAYAAPEQFAGGAITTATDVYALGVLLAELLTGRRPRPADERDSTAQRASRLALSASAEDAARRGTTPAELERRLRGDLDWIVARAIAPDPVRRYGGATALADDIRRHLEGQPVEARPDALSYRAAKFARRHAAALAAAAVVAVALVVATAVSVAQARRAQREAARASAEAARANAVKAFLLDLFVSVAPGEAAPPATADDVLERGSAQALRELGGQPELEHEILSAIGEVEAKRGRLPNARAPLERALAIAVERYGRVDARTLAAASQLAYLDDSDGRFDEGATRFEPFLAAYRAAHPGERSATLAEALFRLASLRTRQGRFDDAIAAADEAVAMARAVPDAAGELRQGLMVRADALMRHSRLDDAVAAQTEALALTRDALGADHVTTGDAHSVLGAIYRNQGKLAEAEQHEREALRINRIVYDAPSPELATSLNNLAVTLALQGRTEDTLALFDETLAVQRIVFEPGHAYIANTLANLGALATRVGDFTRAEAIQREALGLLRAARGADHPMVSRNEVELGRTLLRQGRRDEAAVLIEGALAADLARFAEPHLAIAADRLALADLDLERGRREQALAGATLARDAYATLVAPGHPKALESKLVHARAIAAAGRADEALAEIDVVLATARDAKPPIVYMAARAQLESARIARAADDAVTAAKRLDEAEATLATAVDPERRLRGEIARERKALAR